MRYPPPTDGSARILELMGNHTKVNAFQETVRHKELDGLGERLERAFKRFGAA
jgi:hypothetical protein